MIIDEKTMINGDKVVLYWLENDFAPFQIWLTIDCVEFLYYTSKRRGDAYQVFNDYNTNI